MGNEGNYKLIRFPKNKKFSKNFQISYKKKNLIHLMKSKIKIKKQKENKKQFIFEIIEVKF